MGDSPVAGRPSFTLPPVTKSPLRAWTTRSMPARGASGPRAPKAVTVPTISRGWRGASCSYSRPSSAARPGRMLDRTTSARLRSASRISRACGCFSSSGSACLPRLRMTKCRLSPGARGAMWRLGSPSRGSILITCAPPSARICPAQGTATKWPSSSTVTPSNAALTASPVEDIGHPPLVPARIAEIRKQRARHPGVGHQPVLDEAALPGVDLVGGVARLQVGLAAHRLRHVHGVRGGMARVELPQRLGGRPASGVEVIHETDDVILHALEAADRHAELHALAAVGDRHLEHGLAA